MPAYMTIILSLSPILLPPLIAYLVVFVKARIAKLPADQRALISGIVSTHVAEVEQAASNALNGPGKKQMALEAIQAELSHWNIKVPDVVVNGLLEETVLAIKSVKDAQAASPVIVVPASK